MKGEAFIFKTSGIKAFFICYILAVLVSSCNRKTEKSIKPKALPQGKHLIVNHLSNNAPIIHENSVLPKDGIVPDHKTAVKIAEMIWLPIYGKEIYDERPFNTTLFCDSIWVVSGTLPDGFKGGTVFLKIQKHDGKVLEVGHYE